MQAHHGALEKWEDLLRRLHDWLTQLEVELGSYDHTERRVGLPPPGVSSATWDNEKKRHTIVRLHVLPSGSGDKLKNVAFDLLHECGHVKQETPHDATIRTPARERDAWETGWELGLSLSTWLNEHKDDFDKRRDYCVSTYQQS
jgi:hypothetical protein